MSKNPNQKLKLLYLYQILLQRTDENHKLTTDELRAALERGGITLSAKAFIRISKHSRILVWM